MTVMSVVSFFKTLVSGCPQYPLCLYIPGVHDTLMTVMFSCLDGLDYMDTHDGLCALIFMSALMTVMSVRCVVSIVALRL
jgi:hypothetical protein